MTHDHYCVIWGIKVIFVSLGCSSLHWNALKPQSHVGSRVLIRRNGQEHFHSPTLCNTEPKMLTLMVPCLQNVVRTATTLYRR